MGEPLNNYAAVRSAVGMMTNEKWFGLRRKKVTVSTVGVIPRLLQMADDMPGVRWGGGRVGNVGRVEKGASGSGWVAWKGRQIRVPCLA